MAVPAAHADEQPPVDPAAAAMAVYVESVPTAEGPTAVGVKPPDGRPLQPRVRTELRQQAGEAAPQLEDVATSSGYGAPQRKLPAGKPSRKPPATASAPTAAPERAAPPEAPAPSVGRALEVALAPDASGSSLRMWLLLAGLLGVAAWALAGARRPSSRATSS